MHKYQVYKFDREKNVIIFKLLYKKYEYMAINELETIDKILFLNCPKSQR